MEDLQVSELCGVILDMDGVLWKESQPLADLPRVFEMIRDQGWRVMGMTNNSTRTPQHYLARLAEFGVVLEPWQVINSSEATAHYLSQQHPEGGPVYVVGEEGLISALKGRGFRVIQQYDENGEPLAVVAGMDRGLTYEKIDSAAKLIRNGVDFIGTNPDKTYPTPDGLAPGAGVVLAAIEAASGVKPNVMGKPHRRMYQAALDRMECQADKVLVVGDRLSTDIRGAQSVGCKCALVLSGISTERELAEWSPAPDFVATDVYDLFESITQYE